jgi:transposase
MSKDDIHDAELAAFVGLDWADQAHALCLQEAGSPRLEHQQLKQTPEALAAWVRELLHRFNGRKVAIALEQSRGPLIHALMQYDFLLLYPINPQMLCKYRKAFANSGAKSDPSDAALLLELVRLHRDKLKAWKADDLQTRTLQLLVEGRRKLVNERTRLSNRLTSLLKGYFPQALDWCGSLTNRQGCDFLRKWPTLEHLQRARGATIKRFYKDHGSRKQEKIAQRIKEMGQAEPLTRDPATLRASRVMAAALVAQMESLIAGLEEFDKQIEELFEQHPDKEIFESFPGAGKALGPRLIAAMGGDRERYESASDIQQLSGIAPVSEQSGKSRRVRRRLSCPTFLKQTFHEYAQASLRWSKWAKAYYEQQRGKGKKHQAAVRALAYKWIRIIYRCWKERTAYDEQKYLSALIKRQSSLALLVK